MHIEMPEQHCCTDSSKWHSCQHMLQFSSSSSSRCQFKLQFHHQAFLQLEIPRCCNQVHQVPVHQVPVLSSGSRVFSSSGSSRISSSSSSRMHSSNIRCSSPLCSNFLICKRNQRPGRSSGQSEPSSRSSNNHSRSCNGCCLL